MKFLDINLYVIHFNVYIFNLFPHGFLYKNLFTDLTTEHYYYYLVNDFLDYLRSYHLEFQKNKLQTQGEINVNYVFNIISISKKGTKL